MLCQLIEPIRAILHKAQHNIAWVTKPPPESSGLMAVIEDDLRMILAANFATFRLWSDFRQLDAVTVTVLHFLFATRKPCFPSRVVFPVFRRAWKRAFSAFPVTDESWR